MIAQMSGAGVITQLVTDALSMNAQQDWEDVSLFTPYLNDQALINEYADCLAVQTFLRMTSLPFNVRQRPNVEFISPDGIIPLLRINKTLITGFHQIVDFVHKKGVTLTSHLSEIQVADMRANISMIDSLLTNIELYILWKHDETYQKVTKDRYGSVYHWPLSTILPILKRRSVLSELSDKDWEAKSLDEIGEQAEKVFRTVSVQLGTNKYLTGELPTEADALLFGHLYTLITVRLPLTNLTNILKKYPNLIEFTKRVEQAYFKQ
ncbi:unnamed protein product [Caenorhabditis angaria]|uniref:GST C-terminal domain-containing protein n=1 Tax=Caenorhabditis angaria TaxID=860376 RepID=A0A9P1IG07_9PELO|nr:unnamed protein product [Caenorhabditis angaria]